MAGPRGPDLDLLRQLGVKPPARVLDAGCGWGVTLEALERQGYQAVGMDISRRTLERLDRPGRVLVEADLTSRSTAADRAVRRRPGPRRHRAHRRRPRRRGPLGQLARPGGLVVVSVPALPELFTEFDAIQGHRRRYLPETLRAAFDGTGLRSSASSGGANGWCHPCGDSGPARAAAPASRRRRSIATISGSHPGRCTWAARLAFALEQGPALRGRLRTGTSLFAVARRPAGPG